MGLIFLKFFAFFLSKWTKVGKVLNSMYLLSSLQRPKCNIILRNKNIAYWNGTFDLC
jgi:hypothetical protein